GAELPTSLQHGPYVIFMEGMLAPFIAQKLELGLVGPDQDWLPKLSPQYSQRWVQLSTIGDARSAQSPQFVIPPNDKSFVAQVYPSGEDLPSWLEDSTVVLVSEPVRRLIELRCFIADRRLKAISPYLEDGVFLEPNGFVTTPEYEDGATNFISILLADTSVVLPQAVVVDIGLIQNRNWAVIELNPAFSSGIYGCDPDGVLDCLTRAVMPLENRK
ncbi:MAG: DUF4343 domain-containing protein, partial [Planctomycetes bacterium]|nr:DUF4343 domain-containing protein [Planctomycetota bacterium]